MKTPNINDFVLKSIKLHNNGGAEVIFSHRFSAGSDAQTDEIKLSRTLNVQDSLFKLLEKQKDRILTIRQNDPDQFPRVVEKFGGNDLDKVNLAVEQIRQIVLSTIAITGISISGQYSNKKVCIKFKEQEGNKKIIGSSTSAIQLSASVYGFEEELKEDIEKIKKEVWEYVFKDKHSDSDQYVLFPVDEIGIEEEEE